MKIKSLKKLELNKLTIGQLNKNSTKQIKGGSADSLYPLFTSAKDCLLIQSEDICF